MSVLWQTLVEVQVLGFRVERLVPGGEWERVGADLIPAEGQPHPHCYAVTDADAGVVGGAAYRLIEVDLRGRASVVAETKEGAGLELRLLGDEMGLVLELQGGPGAAAAIQVAERIEGPWRQMARGVLDGCGEGSFRIECEQAGPARFFRVLEE